MLSDVVCCFEAKLTISLELLCSYVDIYISQSSRLRRIRKCFLDKVDYGYLVSLRSISSFTL